MDWRSKNLSETVKIAYSVNLQSFLSLSLSVFLSFSLFSKRRDRNANLNLFQTGKAFRAFHMR